MIRLTILTLQNIPKIGYITIEKLMKLSNFSEINNPMDIVNLLKNAKKSYRRIPVPELDIVTKAWESSKELMETSENLGIKIISKYSNDYPSTLLQIKNHPHLLHVKGDLKALNRDCIAIVGTRKPTEYGIFKAKEITSSLVSKNYAIVAGLAKGIDTIAHEETINSKGVTIAVLAHGLDIAYPKENKKLADDIIENGGVLISEYPIGTKVAKGNFVNRNRIQAGLSFAVIVIESSIKSGTMYTAKFCREQKRMLCVLKPPVNLIESPNFAGNQKLINNDLAGLVIKNTNDKEFVRELNRLKQKPHAAKSSYQNTLPI